MSDINLALNVKEEKVAKTVGWLIKSHIRGSMILCFQKTHLSKTFTLFIFDKNLTNIEHVMAFSATWHSLE